MHQHSWLEHANPTVTDLLQQAACVAISRSGMLVINALGPAAVLAINSYVTACMLQLAALAS